MENLSYFRGLWNLWDNGRLCLLLPPLCIFFAPAGILVSLVFTYDFIRYKYWKKQPLGDWNARS